MKWYGAKELGSTSVLLNNIDKYVKRGQIWPFRPWKWPLERFKQTRLLVHEYPSWEALCGKKKQKTLLNSFGTNGLQMQKGQNLTFPTLKNLERFNQIYLSICDLCHPKEASCQKKKKSYWSVSEIDPSPPPPPPWQTDGQTDDGQLSIKKALLPFGWRS